MTTGRPTLPSPSSHAPCDHQQRKPTTAGDAAGAGGGAGAGAGAGAGVMGGNRPWAASKSSISQSSHSAANETFQPSSERSSSPGESNPSHSLSLTLTLYQSSSPSCHNAVLITTQHSFSFSHSFSHSFSNHSLIILSFSLSHFLTPSPSPSGRALQDVKKKINDYVSSNAPPPPHPTTVIVASNREDAPLVMAPASASSYEEDACSEIQDIDTRLQALQVPHQPSSEPPSLPTHPLPLPQPYSLSPSLIP